MSIAEHMVIYSRPMHAWVRGAVVKGKFVPTAFDSNTHQHSHGQEFDDAVSKAALSYDKLATAFPTGGITSEQGEGGGACSACLSDIENATLVRYALLQVNRGHWCFVGVVALLLWPAVHCTIETGSGLCELLRSLLSINHVVLQSCSITCCQ